MSTIINFIKDIFTIPFGYILGFFYTTTGSYILAITLITLILKLCFLPNAVANQKESIKRIKYKKELYKIKQDFSDDKEKQEQEIKTLRENYQVDKMKLGCLSLFVKIFIFICLFNVLYTPLTSVLHINDNTIEAMKNNMPSVVETHKNNDRTMEIGLLQEADKYEDKLLSESVLTENQLAEINELKEKYSFCGINLSLTPKLTQFNVLWTFPIAVLILGLISSAYSYKISKKTTPGKGKYTASDAITFISPVLSFLITFMFPAGIGLYMVISNIMSFAQTVALNIIYNPCKTTNLENNDTIGNLTGESTSDTIETKQQKQPVLPENEE